MPYHSAIIRTRKTQHENPQFTGILYFLRLAIDILLLECQRQRKDRRKSTKFCTRQHRGRTQSNVVSSCASFSGYHPLLSVGRPVTVAAGSIHQHLLIAIDRIVPPTVYRADVLKFHLRRDHVTEDGRERADNGEKMKSAKTDVTSLAMQLSLHHSTCSSSSRKKLAVAAADD